MQTNLLPVGTLSRLASRWLGGLATGLANRRPGLSHTVIRVGFLVNEEIPLLCVI
jgi:hypothetical protein